MPKELIIDARKTDKIDNLLTGQKHSIRVKRNFKYNVIEMEDVNFHFDSAVLLPDYGPDAPKPGTEKQNRITGLAVIYACYKQSEKENFLQKLLITGHTDKKGSESYNLTLSRERAENVFFMLLGERTNWVNSAIAKNQVEDIQQILKWIDFNFQYDCDPGEKNNIMNNETRIALEKFQKRYNKDFVDLKKHNDKFTREFTRIDEDGKPGKQTWGAFFDMYVLELLIVLGIKEDGLLEIQSKLDFVKKGPGSPAPVVGCGENFPKSGSTTEEANAVDRRVEILFFDEVEVPDLKCHPSKTVCKKTQCDLFNTKDVYVPVPVPVNPLPLPSGVAVRVHLKFMYKTPESDERAFPKDFPYALKFGDGTSELHTIDRDDGQIFLQVLREKKSFTIEFKFVETNYIAAPETGSDEIVPESQVQDKVKNNFRLFSLPLEWNLKNSEWQLTPTVSNFNDTEKEFKNLEDLSVENIGSEASPVKMILDPHWQYVKFLYFDRWVKKKLSIPPVLVEAFNNLNTVSSKADIISNWITTAEGSQAIPWIIREQNKPDKHILLRIRTKQDTYIESSGDKSDFTRRFVTQGSESSTTDPGLNIGESVNINFNFANAFRLRYYDLPKLWKSSKYFAQLCGGKDAPSQKSGRFENLVSEKTEDEKPLIISFDDIILTDKEGKPIDWLPDDNIENRVAIFHHSFAKSGPQKDDLSSVGLYKPDGRAYAGGSAPKAFTGNNLGYFTQLPNDEKDRNYISDYPDWTRAIITSGNIFDVFDKRTEEGKSEVIGARAGVRIFDVFSKKNTFVPPGEKRPTAPEPIKSFFCDIQPLFEQEHEIFNKIGRFDIIRLRCSDVSADRETEIGTCIVYLRIFFNFNKTKDKPDVSEPHNISESDQREWIETAIMNLLKRWNGPDKKTGSSPQTFNPGPAQIISSDTSKLKFKSKVIWYSQQFPKEKSHFELGIYKTKDVKKKKKIRAFMKASDGTGVLDKVDNEPGANGFFTFAHEVGHGGSLVDEYIEQTTPTSFPFATWLDGFDSNSPGAPFSLDLESMMRQNKEVRARHSWHLAELFRKLDSNNFDYIVKHNNNEYFLPHFNVAPIRNFVGWPDNRAIDVERNEHGKYNLFLYPLGKDEYSVKVIPSHTKKEGYYDGIFIVLVKMEFDFPIKDETKIHDFLNNINSRIYKKFNFKFGIKNKSGPLYQNCLLHFATRYYADDYSDTDPRDDDEHIKIKIKENGKAEWDSGILSNKHKLFFPMNVPHIFADFFANMVGLSDGTEDDTSSYLPIVKKLMPDVEIFKFIP